jgi:hypothetical protein
MEKDLFIKELLEHKEEVNISLDFEDKLMNKISIETETNKIYKKYFSLICLFSALSFCLGIFITIFFINVDIRLSENTTINLKWIVQFFMVVSIILFTERVIRLMKGRSESYEQVNSEW